MIAPPKRPSHDEPEALIREARERQLRRRLLGAAGIAVAAAIALGAYALTYGATERSATSNARGTPVPACRSSQLSASTGLGGAAGSLIGPVLIVNRSSAACALPQGRPAVRVTFHGKPTPTVERAWPRGSLGPTRAAQAVAPGAKAMVMLWWSNWCARAGQPRPSRGPVTMILRFAGGLELAAPESTPHRSPQVPWCSDLGHRSISRLAVSRPLVFR
jgi:hypothetical protein